MYKVNNISYKWEININVMELFYSLDNVKLLGDEFVIS